MTFEKGMTELQRLVKSLEENISVDEAIDSFEKSIKVSQYCERKLQDAEDKIASILNQTDPQ
tara:strand:- start:999 stop:1184 length:186 start_codon:yes stop_codon:yes gene_type:complete